MFSCYSFGLKMILKFVTITVPFSEGIPRKLCSHVTWLTMRYFSSPTSISLSDRPDMCYLATTEPHFSMLGLCLGLSISIRGRSRLILPYFSWLLETTRCVYDIGFWLLRTPAGNGLAAVPVVGIMAGRLTPVLTGIRLFAPELAAKGLYCECDSTYGSA